MMFRMRRAVTPTVRLGNEAVASVFEAGSHHGAPDYSHGGEGHVVNKEVDGCEQGSPAVNKRTSGAPQYVCEEDLHYME